MAPDQTLTEEVPSATTEPRTVTPPNRSVVPVKVFAPFSTTVPLLSEPTARFTGPLPVPLAMTPLMENVVPAAAESLPTVLTAKAIPRLAERIVSAVACKVPPAKTICAGVATAGAAPKASSALMAKTPPLTSTRPVKVLDPVNVKVPKPSLVRPPPSEVTSVRSRCAIVISLPFVSRRAPPALMKALVKPDR